MLKILLDRYLEDEYLCNCPNQEHLLSGLGKLPLEHNRNQKTLPELPTGETLSGPETYKKIMRFFTSREITPSSLREKAFRRLNEMYTQVRGTKINDS